MVRNGEVVVHVRSPSRTLFEGAPAAVERMT